MSNAAQLRGITPEVAALIAQQPFYQAGLLEIADLLPQKDSELHAWLEETIRERDALHFNYLISAAALGQRKLNASLLAGGTSLMSHEYTFGWLAWNMEGDVTANLLLALAGDWLRPPIRAMALFVAAAWWQQYREGAPPREIIIKARVLARDETKHKQTLAYLSALKVLLSDLSLRDQTPLRKIAHLRGHSEQLKNSLLECFEKPFAQLVPEKEDHDYRLGQPKRRSVERIRRNESCRCGSGKKYKLCCAASDQQRLRLSTNVAGKTYAEISRHPEADLTFFRLTKTQPYELSRFDPAKVPAELRIEYLMRLAVFECFESFVKAFKEYGVAGEYEEAWKRLFLFVIRAWRRDVAAQLIAVHPRGEAILPELECGVRLLLASDNSEKFLAALEKEALAALKSNDPEEWQRFGVTLARSPYPALGVFLARSVLPLLKEDISYVFDEIVHARDQLNLSPDDEFSEWMNEKMLHKAREHETAAVQEAQDKLALTAREARRAKENNARLEREIALLKRREHSRDEAKASTAASFDPALTKIRELVAEKKRAQALAREKGEAELKARRELERLTKENEDLRAAASSAQDSTDEEDEEGREDFEVTAKQPVRPIALPKTFRASLTNAKPAAARAAMNRIGRIAAGEPAAFDKLKAIVALPGVLEARISDRYRLFFSLLPNCVRVVDLIYRPDMDKTIERYKLAGLPPVPEFD